MRLPVICDKAGLAGSTQRVVRPVLFELAVESAVDEHQVHFGGVDELAFEVEHQAFDRSLLPVPSFVDLLAVHAADDADVAGYRADVNEIRTRSYSRNAAVELMVRSGDGDDGVGFGSRGTVGQSLAGLHAAIYVIDTFDR